MAVIIYHNPRCSKSRQTLQLLQARGIEPEIIEYLKTPPSKTELESLLALLELSPRGLMRTKEAEYRENSLDDPALGTDALVEAMIACPKLMERPIVVVDGLRAAVGRPPERVLSILAD
ncbi:MAG: arsenate reductase (glutaredoxin) [Gammaproteobacteria bacterium]|nr:arsenate reductase (glutaredoxin) [Gammaproteobacteria bacterium]